MLHDTIIALRSQQGADDWLVHHVKKASTQLYWIGAQPESRRRVDSEQVIVTVYNDHAAKSGDGLRRGEASVTLLPGDLGDLPSRLDQAVFMASLTDNPPFGLPGPAEHPRVEIADSELYSHPEAAANNLIAQLLDALRLEKGVRLSSAEVFVEANHAYLENSRQARGEQASTRILLDMVLLANDGDNEMESSIAFERRRAADLDIPTLAHRYAQYARDALVADAPRSGTFPVVVSDEALAELMMSEGESPLVVRSAAEFKYQQMTPWQVGQTIFPEPGNGDPVTIYSNAILPFGTRSRCYDQDGLPAQRTLIVDRGVCAQFWASQRFAEYLDMLPTGQFGNMEVMPGKTAYDQLLLGDAPFYHIVAFSAMSPDPFTGDFVGEIRLGYEIAHGQARPIRGGSISGNLFAVLADARLSQETCALGDYNGPRAMRFAAVTLSGD